MTIQDICLTAGLLLQEKQRTLRVGDSGDGDLFFYLGILLVIVLLVGLPWAAYHFGKKQAAAVAKSEPVEKERLTVGGVLDLDTSSGKTGDSFSSSMSGSYQPRSGSIRGRLLVVDDNEINRRVLTIRLQAEGYEVAEAVDGPTALKQIAEDDDFDLILLDIMMPGMSGYDVCRELRKTYPVQELPIIFLTARTAPNDLVRGFDAGANDYLTKPVSKKELMARVTMHLQLVNLNRLLMKEKEFLASEMEIERLKRLGRESELRLLHTQMDPHFIQNTLSTAMCFCLEDPDKAVHTLDKLSLLLRGTFNAKPNGWWALREEIKVIKAFCDIQKMRFGDKLLVDYQIDHGLEARRLPCFLIQPLVENAVFYSVSKVRDNGFVKLICEMEEQKFHVEVVNRGEPLPVPFEDLISDEHAMGNINKRLTILFGAVLRHKYSEGRHHFFFDIDLEKPLIPEGEKSETDAEQTT